MHGAPEKYVRNSDDRDSRRSLWSKTASPRFVTAFEKTSESTYVTLNYKKIIRSRKRTEGVKEGGDGVEGMGRGRGKRGEGDQEKT